MQATSRALKTQKRQLEKFAVYSHRCFSEEGAKEAQSKNLSQDRQTSAYKFDPKINLILKASVNDVINTQEKQQHIRVRESAMGLLKNYKKTTAGVEDRTE